MLFLKYFLWLLFCIFDIVIWLSVFFFENILINLGFWNSICWFVLFFLKWGKELLLWECSMFYDGGIGNIGIIVRLLFCVILGLLNVLLLRFYFCMRNLVFLFLSSFVCVLFCSSCVFFWSFVLVIFMIVVNLLLYLLF